jgi:MYXO-CTERM domain-containing protein
MTRSLAKLVPLVMVCLSTLLGASARADIPAGYKGLPFDPAVAGGPKLPAGVKAGPYAIPGRLDFINYDMGGDGVGYHAGDHVTKGGAGYRIDGQTATLSWTGQCIPNVAGQVCMNVWYDTSATLDGTKFPSATTDDFSIGAVQVGDWFNLTVNVQTAGTYSVSSTWASGAGPPGGEGGDGSMGLDVFSNNVKIGTWSATFPNFNMYADFHHWKAYPNMMTVTLAAGPQVIKLQSKTKHLQLDYVTFDPVGADGGAPTGAGGASADGGSAGATGATGTAGSNGAAGATDTGGSSGGGGATGAAGNGSGSGTAGSMAGGSAGANGGAGTGGGTGGGMTSGAAGKGGGGKSSGGCAVAPSDAGGSAVSLLVLLAAAFLGRQRRR